MKRTISFLLFFSLLLTIPLFGQGKKKDKEEPAKEKHYLETLSLGGLSFRSVGPAITSGRIADFAVHPDNRAIYYVATASGGVWKTTNGGTTYDPIFDGQGSYSIGCVTLDPNNPNVVWVGTGENNNQRSVAYGDGLYKSIDGGRTWAHMGLKNSEHIGRIVVDPRNSDVVYVAAIGPLWSEGGDRGVYKSTDGGQNWEAVLTVDEHTGVNDLIMDPRNPDVLYASAYQRRRHVFTYVGGGPGSAIYKSTDGGKNWEKANKGLPSVDLGRIGLAISPADPEILYAIVEAAQDQGGFYRSTNRGASWEKRSGYNTSGNYYQELVPHPTKADVVFAMDTWLHWTTNGGKSFEQFNERWKHVDNHCMYIDPKDTDYLLVGCDGGIYESFDGGTTWNYKDNLPVTQFYKVAVDNDLPFYNIYGGTQDNFSMGGPSRTRSGNGIVNADWFMTHGGDGFESQIDPKNPNIVYAQSQYGVLVRYDRASGEELGIQPKPRKDEPAYRWNWDAPLAVSSHRDGRIYFAANKLFRSDNYGGSWEVLGGDLTRQIDRNTLPVMGRIQSIDAVAKNGSTSPYGTIVAFSESPIDQKLLYVGTDDGLIQVSEDGGANWRKVEVDGLPGAPKRTYVNFVLASQHDANVVYAAFNHHKYGDFKPYVYVSKDKGKSWTSISANLPERGSVYSLAEDHVQPNLLFAGTEFGCFFTPDAGAHWKQLKAGLPTVAVRDIDIQERENDLVLATFGRGFYVLDDYSPLRKISEEMAKGVAMIFDIKPALIFNQRYPLGLRGKGFQGDGYYSASNPPVGAAFTYYFNEEIKKLTDKRQEEEKEKIKNGEAIRYPTYEELKAESEEKDPYLLFTVKDQDGNTIRKLKTGVGQGVSRLVWDGRLSSTSPISLAPPSDNIFDNPDSGIWAAPGEYTVTLSKNVNGEESLLAGPSAFELRSLGGVTLQAADLAVLLEFHAKVAELQRKFSGASRLLNDMNNRLRHIRQAVLTIPDPEGSLRKQTSDLEDALDDIRQALYGDPVASRLDQDEPFPVATRLGYLGYEIYGSTAGLTKTHEEALTIALQEFQPQYDRLKKLANEDLKALEKDLEAAGAPYTPGRVPE